MIIHFQRSVRDPENPRRAITAVFGVLPQNLQLTHHAKNIIRFTDLQASGVSCSRGRKNSLQTWMKVVRRRDPNEERYCATGRVFVLLRREAEHVLM